MIGLSKRFSAVILAGGISSRMGGISKQQSLLLGLPVIVYTLQAFERAPSCAEILVVSREDECKLYEDYKTRYGISKLKGAVPGGSTRQESAFIGMEHLPDADYLAFHDAARCLITPENIENVFKAAKKYKSAAACTAASDTIKLVDFSGKTVPDKQTDRSRLRCMQTPQIFYGDLYRAAAYTAKEDGFVGTDDCALLEHVGFGVKTVDCGRENLKITTPVDLLFAEALLRQRKEEKS